MGVQKVCLGADPRSAVGGRKRDKKEKRANPRQVRDQVRPVDN